MPPSRSASIFLIPFLAGTGSILLYHQASENHLNARDVASRQIRPAAIPKDGTHDTYLPSTCIPASKEDAQRMLAEIRSLRDQGGWRELALANVLVAGVASREPELVLGFLLERESAPLRRSCLPTLLNVWVACDPSGAVDKIHACEMTEPDRREIDFRLLGALAEQAPERALKVLEHNNSGAFTGDSFNMVSLYFQAFFSWAIRDPDEAAAQLDGIKDPAQRKNALRGIAIAHARGNFHEALDWCSQSHLDEGSRSEILQMIYLEGFRRDGQAARRPWPNSRPAWGGQTVRKD